MKYEIVELETLNINRGQPMPLGQMIQCTKAKAKIIYI